MRITDYVHDEHRTEHVIIHFFVDYNLSKQHDHDNHNHFDNNDYNYEHNNNHDRDICPDGQIVVDRR
jgi:hypothetical protein